MTLATLIERLKVLQENLSEDVNVLLVEHGFSQGAVQVFTRELVDQDVKFEQGLSEKDLIYSEIDSGVVIGFIPKYEEKRNTAE